MKSSLQPSFARQGVIALIAAISLGTSAHAETPTFELTFNKPQDLNFQNGAQLGAEGSGVSGKLDDKSYTADTSKSTPGAKGPVAEFTGNYTPAQNLDELTVTAWYKPRTGIATTTTLFEAVGASLIWEEKGYWTWRIDTKPANEAKWFYWFPTNAKPPLGSWVRPGEWTFFAATWKRLDKKSIFYQGSSSAPTVVSLERARQELAEPLSENPKFKRLIGNTESTAKDRPFDGNIDNVRFFSKALDKDAIEKIRLADLKNEPVP